MIPTRFINEILKKNVIKLPELQSSTISFDLCNKVILEVMQKVTFKNNLDKIDTDLIAETLYRECLFNIVLKNPNGYKSLMEIDDQQINFTSKDKIYLALEKAVKCALSDLEVEFWDWNLSHTIKEFVRNFKEKSFIVDNLYKVSDSGYLVNSSLFDFIVKVMVQDTRLRFRGEAKSNILRRVLLNPEKINIDSLIELYNIAALRLECENKIDFYYFINFIFKFEWIYNLVEKSSSCKRLHLLNRLIVSTCNLNVFPKEILDRYSEYNIRLLEKEERRSDYIKDIELFYNRLGELELKKYAEDDIKKKTDSFSSEDIALLLSATRERLFLDDQIYNDDYDKLSSLLDQILITSHCLIDLCIKLIFIVYPELFLNQQVVLSDEYQRKVLKKINSLILQLEALKHKKEERYYEYKDIIDDIENISYKIHRARSELNNMSYVHDKYLEVFEDELGDLLNYILTNHNVLVRLI